MTMVRAKFTQAELSRAMRAAMAVGFDGIIEVSPDGKMRLIRGKDTNPLHSNSVEQEDYENIVL